LGVATWETTSTFADLQSFLAEEGCAICRYREQTEDRYFDALLYENVNDVNTRTRLRSSGGFCARHARVLVECGEALGTAILYGDLLNERRRWLHRANAAKALPGGLAKSGFGRDCPACEAGQGAERRCAEVMAAALDAHKLTEPWKRSDGLCWPHFLLVRSLCRAGRKDLDDVEMQCLDRLADDVRELIESYDYQWSGTRPPRVVSAWRRVVDVIIGQSLPKPRESSAETTP
jgi:hypothetical protein